MNNLKVMVIDDCEITLATAKTHLEDDGFHVTTKRTSLSIVEISSP